ncbi:arf-GAP with coiled-coil, ANK repeat and PH domain-containing protein 1 isoform X2 [Corythoichthys intestinalis]|uniref:arf-GAP with coiled-coil, ANK repeat and PH domain-containing protein 1 isoform X2 n=1 Tax=Corythoichthys intestinalis TaxID=161448 RepID=UPI0025A66126|nr:arf-GAP with coiled-coil, ANK repeat and PH domain-containing protein 1 isoform X2 [Corythoichthys intestinalis]XP_061810592.1 arf-GAP with coiled-coil, ANK repeat and PH domain-containing protein 1-like [Nerophis lumbriciformis]
MTIKVDFEECLKDSLRFRAEIEAVQVDVGELETRLDKLVKQCQAMLEAGRVYYQTSKSFVSGLQSLGQHCSWDTVMEECLQKFSEKLSLILDAQGEVIELTQKSVKTKLQTFVKEDVRRFKDARKEFERSSESLDGALAKNAQAPRGKPHEVEEANGALLNARRTFRSSALDYVLEINIIEAKKKTELLTAMLSLMDAQAQLFQNGHRSLSETDRYRQKLNEEHTQFVLNSAREKRDMEQRHAAIKKKDISYDDSMMDFNPDATDGVAMEGYLYKRASNAFKTWSRRWFSIQKNQLVYQKKFKEQPTVVVEDLRLCTVKPNNENERRFCFEVVSPSKSCLLQADSERQQHAWIGAVQNSIASAFQERRDDQHSPRQRSDSLSKGDPIAGRQSEGLEALEEVRAIAGNGECCDCGMPGPDWASINLGITLCIVCSGIHRSLGVHFSKVRSLTLDSWEPELIKLMCELGNGVINGIYEARIDEITLKKPLPSSPRGDKEVWIRSKYVEKKFIQKLPETARNPAQRRTGTQRNRAATQDRTAQRPPLKPKPSRTTLPRTATGLSEVQKNNACSPNDVNDEEEDLSGLHPGALLYRSAGLQNFPVMADALAHGADVNWVNTTDEARTPLIRAVSVNALAACEFLLQNGADVNQADRNGRRPLHHATILGHTGLVCLFLKRGADYNARDKNQKDPITIAVDNANADIVTLLRIAKMNREMQEMDGSLGKSGDETYHHIFKDFSHMASNNPEKLKRRSADGKS